MEENEYRTIYQQFNKTRCIFEKVILGRHCVCQQAHQFCLAEREGVACKTKIRQRRCQRLLEQVRQKALFTLKLTQLDDILPHAKEIRVQLGSLNGLVELLNTEQPETAINIDELLSMVEQRYPSFQTLPFEPLIRAIAKIQGRKHRIKKV